MLENDTSPLVSDADKSQLVMNRNYAVFFPFGSC